MSEPLIFRLPLPANIGNTYMHWAEKHRLKKKYWETLDLLAMARQIPRAPVQRWRRPSGTILLTTWREQDRDNGHARLKFVLDWLQSRGYIENDKWLTYELTNAVGSRKEQGIVLTLHETAPVPA